MERFASDIGISLLVGTPLLVFVKLVFLLATQRLSFAPRGSRRAKGELVGWLLVGAVDSHTLALWLTVTNQPESRCLPHRPDLDTDVYLSTSDFLDYPVTVHCVWFSGERVDVSPWLLNIVTALFVAAAVAVTAHAYHRRAQHGTARH
jgi:hypothetical protein